MKKVPVKDRATLVSDCKRVVGQMFRGGEVTTPYESWLYNQMRPPTVRNYKRWCLNRKRCISIPQGEREIA